MNPKPVTLGRYHLLFELASGGMATAYLARVRGAAGFERLVVIKRVHRHLLQNEDFHRMLVDEAKLASLVRHPCVVPVIDVVEEAGELLLVLEYVESVALSSLLMVAQKTSERVPPNVASRIVLDMLSGLGAAHDAVDMKGQPLNIVHRDVSPQNVIVGVDGGSRLIDFGIAKAAGRLSKTTAGVMKGKLGYMAPEQAKQRPVDRRADLFAAGVVLHETLTGKRLFRGEVAADVLLAMLIAEIPRLSEVVPEAGDRVDSVIELALAQQPDERFENASAFSVALESAIPPAPTREVAKFIERVASEQIEERRRITREFLAQPQADQEQGDVKAGVQTHQGKGATVKMDASFAAAVSAAGDKSLRAMHKTERMAAIGSSGPTLVSTEYAPVETDDIPGVPRPMGRRTALIALSVCSLIGGAVAAYGLAGDRSGAAVAPTSSGAPAEPVKATDPSALPAESVQPTDSANPSSGVSSGPAVSSRLAVPPTPWSKPPSVPPTNGASTGVAKPPTGAPPPPPPKDPVDLQDNPYGAP